MKKFTSLVLISVLIVLFPLNSSSQQWNPLNDQLGVEVFTLCEYNGDLYAGGSFTWDLMNQIPNHIARYDGSQWHPIGQDNLDGSVLSLCVYEDKLYVGGAFWEVDGQPSKYIACWNGTSWEPQDWQIDWFIHKMFVYAGELYFTGPTYAGQIYLSEIGKFDGENVSAVSDDWFYDNIYDMVQYGNDLWVGGAFHQLGDFVADGLAYWNGENWGTPNTGVNNIAYSLCPVFDDEILYIGGNFTMIGSQEISFVAGYDVENSLYFGLGSGISSENYGAVRDMLYFNDKLYVGGSFEVVNNEPHYNFAIWNGEGWETEGTDIGSVNDLYLYQGEVYAGGWISGGVMRWGETSSIENQNNTVSPLIVYPNPAKNNVKIDLTQYPSVKFTSLDLINLVGEKVIRCDNDINGIMNIETHSLPDGIYFISAEDASGIKYIEKFMVMK